MDIWITLSLIATSGTAASFCVMYVRQARRLAALERAVVEQPAQIEAPKTVIVDERVFNQPEIKRLTQAETDQAKMIQSLLAGQSVLAEKVKAVEKMSTMTLVKRDDGQDLPSPDGVKLEWGDRVRLHQNAYKLPRDKLLELLGTVENVVRQRPDC